MIRILLLLMLLIAGQGYGLTINVFSLHNGKGLDTDQKVMKDTLERQGHQVASLEHSHAATDRHPADVNIFFELINPEMLSWARINWFIPNPEWYRQELPLLDRCDLILCRTKEVERIFKGMGKKTFFLGFTSPDSIQNEVPKNYSQLLHLAGASNLKGTGVLMKVWRQYIDLPMLTIVKHHETPVLIAQSHVTWISDPLPEKDLRRLQNQCGIHLCPSETEGFGHYIMEALSVGAVVITTDAPPMNTFVTDPRCLIPCRNSSPLRLATAYHVDPKLLEMKVRMVAALSNEELKAIGQRNRETYLKKTEEFQERLQELLNSAQ